MIILPYTEHPNKRKSEKARAQVVFQRHLFLPPGSDIASGRPGDFGWYVSWENKLQQNGGPTFQSSIAYRLYGNDRHFEDSSQETVSDL